MFITSQAEIPDAPLYVLANDKFMSGWGRAEGAINTVILPCKDWEEANHVESYAMSRDEMRRVRVVMNKPRLQAGHVYSLMSREKALAWYPRQREEGV